jgi:hypothetical protein
VRQWGHVATGRLAGEDSAGKEGLDASNGGGSGLAGLGPASKNILLPGRDTGFNRQSAKLLTIKR